MIDKNRSHVKLCATYIQSVATESNRAVKRNVTALRRLRSEVQKAADNLTEEEQFSDKGDQFREYLESLDSFVGAAAQASHEFTQQIEALVSKLSTELDFDV